MSITTSSALRVVDETEELPGEVHVEFYVGLYWGAKAIMLSCHAKRTASNITLEQGQRR